MFLNGAGKESYLCFKESVLGESRMCGKQCRRRRVSEEAAFVIQVTDVKGQNPRVTEEMKTNGTKDDLLGMQLGEPLDIGKLWSPGETGGYLICDSTPVARCYRKGKREYQIL